MFLKRQGFSLHAIASELNRSPSTLNRALRRRSVEGRPYDAETAGLATRSAHSRCRPRRKFVEGTDLHEVVVDMLRNKWSPQQIGKSQQAERGKRQDLNPRSWVAYISLNRCFIDKITYTNWQLIT